MGWVRDSFADKKILIPLTSSLYVPGRLVDVENVIVDVGTGYFVEKVRGPISLRNGIYRCSSLVGFCTLLTS